ncbi:hypothetical protein OHS71_38500 [Streptomyces sp. NBC_00377]|uniref:hypothetical protein n=1 Tax=unclassified Streptomyces TaxID=2593676 RepID=UPI002E1B3849|nr:MULTISPECIES: hypothetical protein [unclassified Streptomyces]
MDQLWGACYHRLRMPDLLVPEEFAASLVVNLLHGIGTCHRVRRRPARPPGRTA